MSDDSVLYDTPLEFVSGAPDDRLGEVGMAFVILRPRAAATADELTAWARERLANYKVPRHWRSFPTCRERQQQGPQAPAAPRDAAGADDGGSDLAEAI